MRLGGVIEAQVFQNLLDDGRVLERGDDARDDVEVFAGRRLDGPEVAPGIVDAVQVKHVEVGWCGIPIHIEGRTESLYQCDGAALGARGHCHADIYVGQQAKQYLADYNRDEPWFCWVSFGGPHEPWDTPEPYASMYDPARMPAPATDEEEVPRPRGQIDRMRENKSYCPDFDDGDVGAMRANYAGNVSLIDDQIGEILAVIEERGEMDDTVIAFTSDHGEMNGDHGLIYKMNFYDGALRVPLLVRTPGVENTGVLNNSLAENCDLGPTLVELAGGTIDYRQFARSLTGALNGSPHREDVLSEFLGEFMLMTDDWKIAVNREGQTYMLFDRRNDPGETRNLAGLPDYQCDADALRLRLLERVAQSQLREPDAGTVY